ncbi:hypothetical protein [Candidatus Poriferisodalis sp.]|uniref:hypothetical protein n=1 Tax=Candidatus Poriferisodalis sp. TaxID=3101277 RepID=UPI003B018036
MDAVILTQVVSVAVAVLAIVWHQQRSTERLRAEMRSEIGALRTEMQSEIGALRTEMRSEIGALRTEMRSEISGLRASVDEIRERLARIEGYLGIGIPAEAAAGAAGAGLVGGNPRT